MIQLELNRELNKEQTLNLKVCVSVKHLENLKEYCLKLANRRTDRPNAVYLTFENQSLVLGGIGTAV